MTAARERRGMGRKPRLKRSPALAMQVAGLALAVAVTSAGSVGAATLKPSAGPKVTAVTATSGPSTGGTPVTIKGDNLTHVVSVTFDGIKGTSVSVSSTHRSLRVTTPAHVAGQVHVRVKTSAGASSIGAKNLFTYQTYASLTAGGYHTCAVASAKVRCWGDNVYGQLGNTSTVNSSTPVAVVGLSHVVAISAGEYHTCALVSDGTVRCWGYNTDGQLGDASTVNRSRPVKVHGLAHVVAISAGYLHSCAVLANGTARCWGDNAAGELGNHTLVSSAVPVLVLGLTHATAISASTNSSCAVRANGQASCWGYNIYGQLGNGTTSDSSVPVHVIGVAHAIALSTGEYNACVVISGGTVRCWGFNGSGQLGNGTTGDSHSATATAGLSAVTAISGARRGFCALTRGHVYCWGDDTYGQLGNGRASADPWLTPAAVTKLGSATAVDAGDVHTCARPSTGGLRCWGFNFYGELGNGSTTNSSLPVPVSG
jgi:alpha-tubulin suppressor-like RCC1 family protein